MKIDNPILYQIWEDRYCKNDETIEDNLHRVAKFCANNEKEENEFFNIMNEGLFFPAGRTMSNAGIGRDLTLNNCFVAPQIQDDLSDIFDKVKLGAITHQRGGGIGYDFSQLRPKGSPTSNDAIASGAVSFIDCFDSQTATILQGNRRGANMGMMNIYSMDIEDFINAKSYDTNKLKHFNITVMVDDNFIEAKNNNEEVYLHFPVYDKQGNILNDESKWIYKKKINAKYLWDLITQKAYENGEPGIAFYSNMNNDNNLWYIEKIVCSNPCFEYLAGTIFGINPKTNEKLNSNEFGGACNLGSLILHNFVKNPFTLNAEIDFDKLKDTIYISVRLLDNIIDKNKFPHIMYENYQKAFRTIGLGITSLADTLVMLNMKYNSKSARSYVFKLMNFISLNTYKASIELAKEKGEFEFLDREKFIQSGFLQKHKIIDDSWNLIIEDIKKYGIRNAKLLSIAPTGTMSLTFGNNCSSGIEPIFSLSYDRKIKIGGQQEEDTQIIKMEDYAYKLWKETNIDNIVNENIFVTAMNMEVQDHIDMLKRITWHTDMSVSKTINVPTNYSFEETQKIYDECHKAGIKGCTIFRPNELRQGILIDNNTNKKETKEIIPIYEEIPRGYIESVPEDLVYRKYKLKTGCGNLYFFVGVDENDNKIYDCFTNTDGVGGCTVNTQANSRLLSAALRGGVPVEYIIEQLNKSGTCPSFQYKKGKGELLCKGKSCPSAIANVLKDILQEFNEEEQSIQNPKIIPENIENPIKKIKQIDKKYDKFHCPECGEILRNEGGCTICNLCGYSKCS
ncbi:MAG: adenosylcobalamin-dependent ribonucleoside-diphosphate reductase [Tissierellia bacterium]|nr:adenosylcobalamin-dependent ribonucleoside-diphosphate reductase [Tissierellia bacterium]